MNVNNESTPPPSSDRLTAEGMTGDGLTPLALLQWYLESGVDESIAEQSTDWFAVTAATSAARAGTSEGTSAAAATAPVPGHAPNSPPPFSSASKPASEAAPPAAAEQVQESARDLAAACSTLDELREAIESFQGCGLKKTATHTVFADGVAGSDLMLIGEAPGVEEDRQGKPFVGASGQLLDKMFAAIGMSREKDLYIANILPWRPPGNRKPSDAETMICLPFIRRHIELAAPKLLVLLGGTSATTLLQTGTGITRLRGRWKMLEIGGREIPVMPTYHPAYLLRQPQAKGDSWADLQEIRDRLRARRDAPREEGRA